MDQSDMEDIAANIVDLIWHDIPTGICIANTNGKLVSCNGAYSRAFGLSEIGLMGDNWKSNIHQDDIDRVIEEIENFPKDTSEINVNFRIKTPDGSVRYLEKTIKRIVRNGKHEGYVGLTHDVTCREEAKKNLEMIKSELIEKEKLATIGQTTAVVSHELRNPLATIRNSIFILNKICEHDESRPHLDRIERSITRCDKIIQELLDFTKNTKDKKEWFLLHEEVSNALETLSKPPSIQMYTDISPVKPINGVPSKIVRAVINIVQNGFDAMIGQSDGRMIVRVKQIRNRAWVMVANTGSHVEDKVKDKIFEPLFSTKGFGVGLGLPVARKMFEEHGGGLKVKNISDKGVVFAGWVSLEGIIDV